MVGAEPGESMPDAAAERLELVLVERLHRRLELALVGFEGVELQLDPVGDVFEVVGGIGLPEQQRIGPMVGKSVISEEVGIAGRHDAFAREQPGMAMIGMEAVPLPGVVAQHDLRSQFADDASDFTSRGQVAVEFAVDAPKESDLACIGAGEAACGLTLFVLAPRCERSHVDIGIPRALRPVGAHQVVDDTTIGGPLRQHAAGPEFHVVGVGSDCQRR